MAHRFADVDEVTRRLAKVSYLATPMIANVAFLADRLEKPMLAEGPAGVGKTELAKALAAATGARLIRLQCYEGLDEGKALYEWDYNKQLLRLQADRAQDASWAEVEADIFSEPFLLTRPLLEAIRAADPVVLLIDEVDRVEMETEALLLEVLSDYQVSIPELGTVAGTQRPLIVLTSNSDPGAVGGAAPALPLPPHRLPGRGAGARDRPGPRARGRRAAGHPDRRDGPVDPPARPEEGAIDLGDDRLGQDPAPPGAADARPGDRRRHPAPAAQARA